MQKRTNSLIVVCLIHIQILKSSIRKPEQKYTLELFLSSKSKVYRTIYKYIIIFCVCSDSFQYMYVIVVYILALYLPLYQCHCHLKPENDHIVNNQNEKPSKQRNVFTLNKSLHNILLFFFLNHLYELPRNAYSVFTFLVGQNSSIRKSHEENDTDDERSCHILSISLFFDYLRCNSCHKTLQFSSNMRFLSHSEFR